MEAPQGVEADKPRVPVLQPPIGSDRAYLPQGLRRVDANLGQPSGALPSEPRHQARGVGGRMISLALPGGSSDLGQDHVPRDQCELSSLAGAD